MLIYLSGPMTGIRDYNYPAFRMAAANLRAMGMHVLNPAETAGGTTHLPRETFMKIDIGYVEAADALIVMEGWGNSDGARLEVLLANALGKPIYQYDPSLGFGGRIYVTGIGVRVLTTTMDEENDGFDIDAYLKGVVPEELVKASNEIEDQQIILWEHLDDFMEEN